MIAFRHVSKVFGSGDTVVRAVDNLSFECPAGGFWALTGPSGSGKSTVLHLIAGLTPPTSGRVLVDGADVAGMTAAESAALRRRRIGYILQSFNLLPFLTARENVGMPLVLDGVRQAEVDARVHDALTLVNLAHRAGHHPTHLSGGEQQRLAIARALVIRPAISSSVRRKSSSTLRLMIAMATMSATPVAMPPTTSAVRAALLRS